jgi:hypothetical protein
VQVAVNGRGYIILMTRREKGFTVAVQRWVSTVVAILSLKTQNLAVFGFIIASDALHLDKCLALASHVEYVSA